MEREGRVARKTRDTQLKRPPACRPVRPPEQMPATTPLESAAADPLASQLAQQWLSALNRATLCSNLGELLELFATDGHWRDLLALTGVISTHSGKPAIEAMLAQTLSVEKPTGFRIAAGRTAPRFVTRAGREVVEVLFEFDSRRGAASGVLRLLADQTSATGGRAWILLTALDSLRGHEERTGPRRPSGDDYSREFGGENWLDKRNRAGAYEDHDPAVLVIGAGQAGLSIAARLGALGVDTLVIDRQARVGDNWRRRYHSLTLHNEVHVNHLPYLPFPENWPVFIPKDKLANWFEFYVDALELNCWMGTEWQGGQWIEADQCWQIQVRRADGSVRKLRPRHIVFATGVSALAHRPNLPGLESFKGEVLHSGEYTEGSRWRGKTTLVLGTGNSGHDVAQDLQASGAQVTIIQRSPSYVVGIREAQRVYSLYAEGMPLADCDLLATAMPYPVLRHAYQLATAISREADKPLLDALESRGFRLTFGADNTGFQMMYLRRGGGYYFNVGCSDLIIDGRVGLLQFDDIETFVPHGVQMRDGRVVEADLLVTATGYKNQQDVVRELLGDSVAERVGPVWNFGEDAELRNLWRPTAQPGLWFTAGSLAQCRIFSKYLALQIKEREVVRRQ